MTPKVSIATKPLEMVRTFPFRFAWINDLHIGAQFGLSPKSWNLQRGQQIKPNKGQKKLYQYFKKFAKECFENKTTILVIVGDVITGQNRKELGQFTMITDLNEQIKACADVIADFCEMVPTIQEIWIWKGTGYHSSLDTSIEEAVCNKLKSIYNLNALYLGEYSLLTLKHGKYKKTLFITHPASSAYMYPEQSMGRDMMLWQEAVGNKKLPPVDMIVRAHKHSFIEVHKPAIRALQLPCWQFFVPYDSALKNFPRYQPDIGGVIMLFDEKLRTTVWHFIYPNLIGAEHYLVLESNYGVTEKRLSKK